MLDIKATSMANTKKSKYSKAIDHRLSAGLQGVSPDEHVWHDLFNGYPV